MQKTLIVDSDLAPVAAAAEASAAATIRDVACFDVYDTILTRSVFGPHAVFLLVGERLQREQLIDATAEMFARARIEAGASAARNRKGEEIQLEDVYAELAHLLDWTAAQRAAAMACELGVEAALLRPVPGAAARLEQARAAGRQVVFLSDMYLGDGFIPAQLRCHGMMHDGDLCFVSCEIGVKKLTGNAFREVARRLDVPLHAITHTGNDPGSDVAAALRTGVRAVPFYEGNGNRYEAILGDHSWASGALTAVMAGASRLARLEVAASHPTAPSIREVGAGVAGPALAGYVLWVLRRAQKLGLRRLYFVARDGEILLEVAREIAPKLDLDIELRYLYGSRQAWHGATMDGAGENQLSWILENPGRLSVRSVLALLEMEPEQIREPLEAAGFDESSWDAVLDPEARRRVAAALQAPPAATALTAIGRERRELLIRYLGQEGLLDDDRWALVDVGWRGRAQASLSRVLAMAGRPPARGFYFGMIIDSTDPAIGSIESYLFHRNEAAERGYFRSMWGYFQILEMFCSGTHGTTLGYRDENGLVVPVLKEKRNTHLETWGGDALRAAVRSFARNLDFDFVDPYRDCRAAVADLLRAFWTEPSPAEAREWGAFMYEDDQTGVAPLAEPYTLRHIFRGLRHGVMPLHNRSTWWQASMLLARPHVRWTLRQSIRASNLARRLLRPLRQRLERKRRGK